MLADPPSSGSRRLKGGGSQDWLPHFFDPVRLAFFCRGMTGHRRRWPVPLPYCDHGGTIPFILA
jgi:hypothetical protein